MSLNTLSTLMSAGYPAWYAYGVSRGTISLKDGLRTQLRSVAGAGDAIKEAKKAVEKDCKDTLKAFDDYEKTQTQLSMPKEKEQKVEETETAYSFNGKNLPFKENSVAVVPKSKSKSKGTSQAPNDVASTQLSLTYSKSRDVPTPTKDVASTQLTLTGSKSRDVAPHTSFTKDMYTQEQQKVPEAAETLNIHPAAINYDLINPRGLSHETNLYSQISMNINKLYVINYKHYMQALANWKGAPDNFFTQLSNLLKYIHENYIETLHDNNTPLDVHMRHLRDNDGLDNTLKNLQIALHNLSQVKRIIQEMKTMDQDLVNLISQ